MHGGGGRNRGELIVVSHQRDARDTACHQFDTVDVYSTPFRCLIAMVLLKPQRLCSVRPSGFWYESCLPQYSYSRRSLLLQTFPVGWRSGSGEGTSNVYIFYETDTQSNRNVPAEFRLFNRMR